MLWTECIFVVCLLIAWCRQKKKCLKYIIFQGSQEVALFLSQHFPKCHPKGDPESGSSFKDNEGGGTSVYSLKKVGFQGSFFSGKKKKVVGYIHFGSFEKG